MIPADALPDIARRYLAGEPLASIAADYGVSPQAISWRAHRLTGQRRQVGGHTRRDDLDERTEEIVARYRAGASTYALARRYHCSPTKIGRIVAGADVPLRPAQPPRKIALAVRGRLLDEREAGHTVAELAEDYGVCAATVRAALADARERRRRLAARLSGTPTRTPGWRRRGRGRS